MKKLYIGTILQKIESKTTPFIGMVSENNEIIHIGKYKEEKGYKWQEFDGELEEGVKLKILYDGGITGKDKKFLNFVVGEQIKEGFRHLIKYN